MDFEHGLFLAIQNSEPGRVGPVERRHMCKSAKIFVFSAAIRVFLDVVQDIVYPEEQDNQFAIDSHRQRPEYHIHQTKNKRSKSPMEHNSKTENNTHRDADPKYDLNDERRNHFAE
jgi:hypothetical protein